jgi:hypothetical protein
MPDLSVTIVNYNTRDKLKVCVESLLHEKGDLSLEILVVDNGSKDGSQAMMEELASQHAEVIFINPARNTWFTGGNNLAMQQATGDYVYILNPDTIIQPNTLQTMLAYLKQHAHVGAVSCRMIYPDGRLQPTCSRAPRYIDLLLGYTFLGALLFFWRAARRREMWYEGWQRDTDKSVEVVPDSNLMLSRALQQQVGYFDERMKLYFTEDDLCRRILATGKEIHFLAHTYIEHHERSSTQQVQRTASQAYFDDLVIYSLRYYGTFRTRLLQSLVIPTRSLMDVAQRLRGERTV